MPAITLGFSFVNGQKVSPTDLHRLVDEAAIGQFANSDFSGNVQYFTYGPTRPSLVRGAAHYDTTAGLEGMYFAFVSASNGSVSGWLCATPRRECYCWAATNVSAGMPVFLGRPHIFGEGRDYTIYDGMIFPTAWTYSGASGADAAYWITLESAGTDQPVKCMWAGLLPSGLLGISAPSDTNPLYVNVASSGQLASGAPTSRSVPIGIGSILWGSGAAIVDWV